MSSCPKAPIGIGTAFAVLGIAALGGFATTVLAFPVVHDRYFPWIVGRALGLAAYFCLLLLVALGIWLRHPWRLRWPLVRHETALRYHAALAGATAVLVIGHLASLASDSYAGVGWLGALVPGRSTYRPIPVAIGVSAWWALVLVAATARIGGCLVGRHWLSVHRLALPIFASVFVHGLLAGTDGGRLRPVYAASGALVLVLWLSRHLVSEPLTSTTVKVVDARSALSPPRAGQ